MATQNLPTDKFGNIYYGPTTYAAAVKQIEEGQEPDRVRAIMADAGYKRIAARLHKRYGDNASGYGCPI